MSRRSPAAHRPDDSDSESVETVRSPADQHIRIHRWKVREGFQVTRNHIVLLYSVVADPQAPGGAPAASELRRLKVQQTGVVRKRLHKDGDIVPPDTPLFEIGPCIHATVIKDMCADCGADLRRDDQSSGGAGNAGSAHGASGSGERGEAANVPMIHSVPELKVSQQLAQKLGKADTRRLLEDRKLVLLVDLDQTIIHTTNDHVPLNIRDVYHFQLYGPHSPWYHTRLRPGTFQFLSRMAPMFELHICTFGARNYAHKIAQFLDADGKYFSHRILSRDECFSMASKTDNLKALFPCGDSMVCIIDDREDVWNMATNLIQVKPYHFFQHTGDINAPPGLAKHELDGKGVRFKDGKKNEPETKDAQKASAADDEKTAAENSVVDADANEASGESKPADAAPVDDATAFKKPAAVAGAKDDDQDTDDYLLYLESILEQIHRRFYAHYDEAGSVVDLKQLVPRIRGEVLRGRTLVFSGLVPNQQRLEVSKAYVIARGLGAVVKQQLTDDTTHLVAATAGTFKVNAARKRPEIQVVTPEWLWTCAERWECVEERLFPLDPLRPSKMRQPPPHCHSPEHATNYNEGPDDESTAGKKRAPDAAASSATAAVTAGPSASSSADNPAEAKFIDTLNPLLSFSTDELADMKQEFDQFFESDDGDSSDEDGPSAVDGDDDDESADESRPRNYGGSSESPRKRKRSRRPELEDSDAAIEAFNRAATADGRHGTQLVNSMKFRRVDDDSDDRGSLSHDEDAAELQAESSGSEHEGIDYNSDDDAGGGAERNGSDCERDEDDEENDEAPDEDDEDDNWSQMGADLEREFLGLD